MQRTCSERPVVAIYAMVERQQLPGIIRISRRVLFRSDDLLDWLDQKRVPSLKE
jgi:predicted DNA-binding transcriptional regulator AlpA